MIRISDATVTYTNDGCVTTFEDGASYGAQPHSTAHYSVASHRCGYGDDLLTYCREHEVCHLIVESFFLPGRSGVLRKLAHNEYIQPEEAAGEELMVMALQRWLRANERPIVGGFDWDRLKEHALALLDG